MMNKLAIFGTSGFANEVADIAYALGVKEIVFLTNEEINLDDSIMIFPESKVEELNKNGYKFAIGIGKPVTRKKIHERYPNYSFPNLIHPNSSFGHLQAEKIKKSMGNIITAGVVFTNNISVGNFGVYNLNATIGHDCIIGDYVSIMPSVNISGNVQIKNSVFVGVGATVLQGTLQHKIILGENSVIGAASLVTKSVDNNLTVIGAPAKPLNR